MKNLAHRVRKWKEIIRINADTSDLENVKSPGKSH